MFKKLHLHMMLYCVMITGIIMIGMSVMNMFATEQALKANTYISFQDDATAMVASLENQTVISDEWIARMEKNGQYIISLSNNGLPLFYDTLNHSAKQTNDIKKATDLAYSEYNFKMNSLDNDGLLTRHIDFILHEKHKEIFYISAARISNGSSYLSALIIYPLETLHKQITGQRLQLLLFDFCGLILLCIFSYFFTKWVIRPLRKSREQQVQFIAAASHELRTPLTVIMSGLSAMKIARDEERERFHHVIASEGTRMARLIDDLLTLARMDSSGFDIHFSTVEVDTLLLDTAEKFEPLATQKKIRLTVDLPEEAVLPFTADRERLIQVFSILLDNAISYTPEKGQINLSLKWSHHKLKVRVADSGPGIPDDFKEQIWERFFRLDKSHSDRKHFGLGLSIAREIIRKHKGEIRVEDAADYGGAAFIVVLPLREE